MSTKVIRVVCARPCFVFCEESKRREIFCESNTHGREARKLITVYSFLPDVQGGTASVMFSTVIV